MRDLSVKITAVFVIIVVSPMSEMISSHSLHVFLELRHKS